MSQKFEDFLKLELTPGAKLVALAAIRRGSGNHLIRDLVEDVNLLVGEVNMVQVELRQAGINTEKMSYDTIRISPDNPFLGMLDPPVYPNEPKVSAALLHASGMLDPPVKVRRKPGPKPKIQAQGNV